MLPDKDKAKAKAELVSLFARELIADLGRTDLAGRYTFESRYKVSYRDYVVEMRAKGEQDVFADAEPCFVDGEYEYEGLRVRLRHLPYYVTPEKALALLGDLERFTKSVRDIESWLAWAARLEA